MLYHPEIQRAIKDASIIIWQVLLIIAGANHLAGANLDSPDAAVQT